MEKQKQKQKAEQWVVYYLFAPQAMMMKIGYTSEFKKRLSGIQVGCPEPLVTVALDPCPNAAEARFREECLHQQFRKLNGSGEWFKLNGSLLDHALAIRAEHKIHPTARDLLRRDRASLNRQVDRLRRDVMTLRSMKSDMAKSAKKYLSEDL